MSEQPEDPAPADAADPASGSGDDGAPGGGGRAGLGVIFLTIFIDLVGFSVIFPLFPAMLDYYLPREGPESLIGRTVEVLGGLAGAGHGDPGFLTAVLFGGVLGSLYSLLQFVFAPVWGALSDRRGRRPVLLFTVAGTALSYLLWIFSGSFALLVAARVLGGVMGGNLSVATAAVADVTSRRDRARGMAVVGVAFGLGFIVGPAIGGLASLGDLRTVLPGGEALGLNPFSLPALAAFLLAVLNLVWVWARFAETLPEGKRKVDPEGVGGLGGIKKAACPLARVTSIFAVPDPDIRRTVLVYFLFILSFAGMEFTLTFLAVERLAYAPAEMVKIFLFVGVVLILVQGGFVRRMAPRWGEKRLALGGVAACLAAFAFLALAPVGNAAAFYAGLALLGIGAGCATPTLSALVSLYSPEDQQGRDLGVFRSAGSFARAVGPFIAAALFWALGSKVAYATGAALLLAPLLIGARLRPPVEAPAGDPSPTPP